MKTPRCARVAMPSPWPTCRSAITFWRAAPCKTASSCPSLLWLLDPNNGNACRKWVECVPADREIPGLAELRKNLRSRRFEVACPGPALSFSVCFCWPLARPGSVASPAGQFDAKRIGGAHTNSRGNFVSDKWNCQSWEDAAAWRNCHRDQFAHGKEIYRGHQR